VWPTIIRTVVAMLDGGSAAATAILECLVDALTPRSRLVVLSHLLWNIGQVMPIAAAAARLASGSQSGTGFHSDARRFEVATSCTPLFAGLETSLQLPEAEGKAPVRLTAN